jgi:hypothetical protein
MKKLTVITMLLGLATIYGQERTVNPPYSSSNLHAPRGNPESPDGRFEWRVKTSDPVAYQLVQKSDQKLLVAVPSELAAAGGEPAVRYARAYGVYWNRDSDLVVLDELNYRRAGQIYFYHLRDGVPVELPVATKIPRPAGADEVRLVADKGWISPTKFSVRQAMKSKGGDFKSLHYVVDLSDPQHPKVEKGGK